MPQAARVGQAWPDLPPEHLLLGAPGDAQALSPAAFDAWCAGHAGATVTLWLSATWLQVFTAEPALPLADAELADHARGVLAHYLGDAAAAPLATWASAAGRGACLLQGVDLDALLQSAQQHRVRLRAVAPWWCGQLARALAVSPPLRRAAQARLLVVDHRLLTVLVLAQGQLQRVTQHRLDAATEAALAEAWLAVADGEAAATAMPEVVAADPARQAGQADHLGHGALGDRGPAAGLNGGADPADQRRAGADVHAASGPWLASAPVYAIGHGLQGGLMNPPWQALGRLDGGPLSTPPGPVPRAWWTAWRAAPDFLQPRRARQTRRAGWAVAGLAALLLVTAAWAALQAHQGLVDAEQRLAQAGGPAGDAGSTGPGRGARPAQAAMAAQDTAWLMHPWADRLAAVESVAMPGLRWTALDLAADRPQVHLAGRADEASDVLQAAQRLASRPGWAGLLTTSLRPLAEGGVAFEWAGSGLPEASRGPARAPRP